MSTANVAADYKARMGHQLGVLFCALMNACALLHWRWADFRELFGTSPARIALLNGAAQFLFGTIQEVLWENTLLQLARLTDPAKTGGRANLTLQRLPVLVDPKIRKSTQALLQDAIRHTAFARDWRNRQIAHSDLALALRQPIRPLAVASRKHVGDALKAIADLLNHVEQHYRGSPVAYDQIIAPHGNAVTLLYVIRDGLDAQVAQRKRFQEGKPLPEDRGPARPI
jgi:hypothetical protein